MLPKTDVDTVSWLEEMQVTEFCFIYKNCRVMNNYD